MRVLSDIPGMNTVATPTLLVVATHRAWIAEHFTQAGICPVRLDHGFDAPLVPNPDTTAWWTPTEHAARLLRSGLEIPFQAPGPDFLARIPREYLHRDVWTGTLTDISDAPESGFCKAAEAKIEALPAAWWNSTAGFAAAAAAAGVPASTRIQVTGTRLNLKYEYRTFITRGRVTAVSCYLADGETHPFPKEAEDTLTDAAAFATEVADVMSGDQPDGWVLDVGLDAAGFWVVIEANPAWSSNPYWAEPAGVVEAVAAATLPGECAGFTWDPDPWILQYAARRPTLRLSPLPAVR